MQIDTKTNERKTSPGVLREWDCLENAVTSAREAGVLDEHAQSLYTEACAARQPRALIAAQNYLRQNAEPESPEYQVLDSRSSSVRDCYGCHPNRRSREEIERMFQYVNPEVEELLATK